MATYDVRVARGREQNIGAHVRKAAASIVQAACTTVDESAIECAGCIGTAPVAFTARAFYAREQPDRRSTLVHMEFERQCGRDAFDTAISSLQRKLPPSLRAHGDEHGKQASMQEGETKHAKTTRAAVPDAEVTALLAENLRPGNMLDLQTLLSLALISSDHAAALTTTGIIRLVLKSMTHGTWGVHVVCARLLDTLARCAPDTFLQHATRQCAPQFIRVLLEPHNLRHSVACNMAQQAVLRRWYAAVIASIAACGPGSAAVLFMVDERKMGVLLGGPADAAERTSEERALQWLRECVQGERAQEFIARLRRMREVEATTMNHK